MPDDVNPDPKAIGAYVVNHRLGEGGMGVVYHAVSPAGEPVALKVLRQHLLAPIMVRRFEREASVQITHPNIARVIDCGVDDGTPFIAFELLEGETLASRLSRGRAAPEQVIAWGIDACAGLTAAHGQGIVHRDIKPSNIFLTKSGELKLLDFGVAQMDDGSTKLTQTGAVPGTVGYLSPEQAKGEVVVDLRTDLWSLGAVLYEALTGTMPFKRDSPLATLVATLMSELPPIRSLNPDVPVGLANVVERVLSREREKRFSSAETLSRALNAVDLSGESEGAAPGVSIAGPKTGLKIGPKTGPMAGPAAGRPTLPHGERRVVALLFAEGVRDPAAAEAAVAAQGGRTLHLHGSRALGIFGAERWEGSEVASAAKAAVLVREVASRVAVSSGWATEGGEGVLGEALLAAERCAAAALEGVAIDSEAALALRDLLPLVEVTSGLFELEKSSREPSPTDTRTMLGREAEIAQLSSLVRTAVEDKCARAALVIGPPGIGKTRLRSAIEESVSTGHTVLRVLSVAANPRSQRVELALIRELALAALSVDERDPNAVAAALRKSLRESVRNPADVRRFHVALERLFSLGNEAELTTELDTRAVRDGLRVAFLEWFGAMIAARPHLLLLEDLHWADDLSIEILEDLFDENAESALVVLGFARPSLNRRAAVPFDGRDVVRIEPRGLSSEEVGRLIREVAEAPLSTASINAIAERSGGNPFFVVQLVRAIQARAEPTDEGELPLPRTVEAAVQSRLDHLPEAERDLCRRVSVWDRPFSCEEAVSVGVADPTPLLVSLSRSDLVSVRGRGDRARYQFRSALVGEVAYQTLDEPSRRTLHRLAAEHLQNSPSLEPEERARHHELGGEAVASAKAYVQAAVAAGRRGDSRSALRCADRALALHPAPEDIFGLHAVRVDALRFMGRNDEQFLALEAAQQAAPNDAERARMLSERTVWLSRKGQNEEAVACAEKAAMLARSAGDKRVLVLVLGRQSLALHQMGSDQLAGEALGEAVSLAEDADLPLRAIVLGWRGVDATARGNLTARLEVFQELAEVCDELGDLRRAAGARANVADVYNRLGMHSDAAEALTGALGDCRRVGHRAMEGYVLLNLAYSQTALGQIDSALTGLEGAEAIADETGEARLKVLVFNYRARALIAERRADDAVAAVESALAAGAKADLEVTALTLLSRALLFGGDLAGAETASNDAYSKYEALGGMEEEEAEVFAARAQVLEALGHTDVAKEVRRQGRLRVEALAGQIADGVLRKRFLEKTLP